MVTLRGWELVSQILKMLWGELNAHNAVLFRRFVSNDAAQEDVTIVTSPFIPLSVCLFRPLLTKVLARIVSNLVISFAKDFPKDHIYV